MSNKFEGLTFGTDMIVSKKWLTDVLHDITTAGVVLSTTYAAHAKPPTGLVISAAIMRAVSAELALKLDVDLEPYLAGIVKEIEDKFGGKGDLC